MVSLSLNIISLHILRDPGTFCMTKILTHETLIFVLHGPSGMIKTWLLALNLRDIFYGQFFYHLNNFSHGVHQLPNYLSEYMVVAYQKMQNGEWVLKIYITIISVYENRE